jgi:hypothetical protein
LIVAFFVVTFLPIRIFVILGCKILIYLKILSVVLRKFARGKTYYQRRYTGNKEAFKIELYNFLTDQNYLKHHPNYYQRMRAGIQAAQIYD